MGLAINYAEVSRCVIADFSLCTILVPLTRKAFFTSVKQHFLGNVEFGNAITAGG
jgi:hypothetical protein